MVNNNNEVVPRNEFSSQDVEILRREVDIWLNSDSKSRIKEGGQTDEQLITNLQECVRLHSRLLVRSDKKVMIFVKVARCFKPTQQQPIL